MGCPPRSNHNDKLPHSSRNCRRPRTTNRTIHLFARTKHHPILLRRHNGLHIPSDLDTKRPKDPIHLPNTPHNLPPIPRRHLLIPRLPLRLRQSPTHRLLNLHSREIMQAPPRHGPAPDHLPQEIPPVQVRRGADGHPRRGDF